MAFSLLNNISSLVAQDQLAITGAQLQKTLFRLASGSRINSGADDAAGLAIADNLRANITALTQSVRNANDGIGSLQVGDGAFAQVTNLLNRAVTLATQAGTGTVSSTQRTALDAEFTQIKVEIDQIGLNTTFNGASVFSATTTSIFLSDSSASSTIAVTVGILSQSSTGASATNLSANSLTSQANAQTALTNINAAIASVASSRGTLGASINRLQAASAVAQNQVENIAASENAIRSADIGQEVANMSKFQILNQTGIAALAQANSSNAAVLALLR